MVRIRIEGTAKPTRRSSPTLAQPENHTETEPRAISTAKSNGPTRSRSSSACNSAGSSSMTAGRLIRWGISWASTRGRATVAAIHTVVATLSTAAAPAYSEPFLTTSYSSATALKLMLPPV